MSGVIKNGQRRFSLNGALSTNMNDIGRYLGRYVFGLGRVSVRRAAQRQGPMLIS